jgi:hypothetical protein
MQSGQYNTVCRRQYMWRTINVQLQQQLNVRFGTLAGNSYRLGDKRQLQKAVHNAVQGADARQYKWQYRRENRLQMAIARTGGKSPHVVFPPSPHPRSEKNIAQTSML